MQDVNARIIVAVESAKAEQQTRRVKDSIKGITDAPRGEVIRKIFS